MNIFKSVLEVLEVEMTEPTMYGWFHIMWLILTVAASVLLCRLFKEGTEKQVHRIVFFTAILVTVLEVYKQIVYTFSITDGAITSDFKWYAFPFQFCSTPMYAGLLFGIIRKGKVHNALGAFLASYAIFAGVCVMLYPNTVFIDTIGINIQTMVCHSSMIVIGVYLLYTGYVPLKHKTVLKAIPVFAAAVAIAAVMNEIAFKTGLLETDEFNMFFISPHCEPSLPLFSLVQPLVPFAVSLVIYIGVFTLAAYIMILIAMLIKKIASKLSLKRQKELLNV
ncbi:MAG: hypothetical protein E7525_03085 [Ruminococcaceae bacterium]|nr:hypothetical protein [Oscillospiraceae bacterium]